MSIKSIAKTWLCRILERQVVQLRRKHPRLKVVAVVGSMGKTSTKLAVAQTLESAGLRVQYQTGNYNDRLTVPLVVFGHDLPSLVNPVSWMRIWWSNRQIIKGIYPFDVVVLELGTDGPGQIAQFNYLKPDLSIVTAVAPEHMEYFGTLEAVAKEELAVKGFSRQILLNVDDIAEQYRSKLKYKAYSLVDKRADYQADGTEFGLLGQNLTIRQNGNKWGSGKIVYLGAQGRKIVLAAVAAADLLGVAKNEALDAISKLEPFSGRMQLLEGIHDSTIIDDTYNAAPAAVEAALNVLNKTNAPQRIAVIGSMNELGDFSAEAHRTIGASINSGRINMVVTIGQEARDYLAPAAKANGCLVVSFTDPADAGKHVKKSLKRGAVVLFKGSQNGVFAEEAIKPILADKTDAAKLVRQSPYWMAQKRQQFGWPLLDKS